MAFASSSSAFGVKPPNTFGTFGATNNTTNQPAATTSIFGASNQQQPGNTGSFFGASQPQQQQQQQNPSSFGLFGQQPQQANQTQGTNIFGQSQPQQSTSLFGQPQQNQAQNQPQQNQPTSNIFGQPTAGLFGQSQQPQQQQQQQQQSGSLFGQQGAQQNAGTSLFGSAQQPQATGPTSLFGQSQPQPQQQQQPTSLFGTFGARSNQPQQPAQQTLFGASQAQAQAPLLSSVNTTTQQSQAPFTRSTKFNDLPDAVKKVFEEIDTHIQGRIHIANDLKSRSLGEEIEKCSQQVRSNYKQFQDVSNTLQEDQHTTEHYKAKLDECVQDTIAATRIIEGFRNQQASGIYLKNYASFPLEFFTKVTNELKERLQWYKTTVEQIERKISSSASRTQYTPQAITSTLQVQHSTFVSLADRTAELHGELEQIKNAYRAIWRAKNGSKRDPFEGGLAALEIS